MAAQQTVPPDLCPGPKPPAPMPATAGGLPPPPSTPPPPVPPPPPDAGEFLRTPLPSFAPTGDARFDAYVRKLLAEGGNGWQPYLVRMIAGTRPNPAILAEAASYRPPARAADYVRRIVTPEHIAEGRRLYAELKGRRLAPARADVPAEYVIALWAALSSYGTRQPRFDMIETYLNLGACGVGPSWGYFDIFHAAALVAQGRLDRSQARAYGNGRIGQVQWFPDQYVSWGKDGDGDGRIDIWSNRADIFANLAPNDWDPGVPPVIEVERPVADLRDPGQARMWQAFQQGSQMGLQFFRRPGGGAWPADLLRASGTFAAPFGQDGPFFLLTRNYTPIAFMNPHLARYAAFEEQPGFAIAVTLLADQIAGRPGPVRPIR